MTDREFAHAFGDLLADGLVDVDQVDEHAAPRFRPTALCHLALEFERRNPGAAGDGGRGAAFPPTTREDTGLHAHADEAETIAAAPPSAEGGVSPSVRSTPAE